MAIFKTHGVPFLSALTILFTVSAQAEFKDYQNLVGGQAQLVHSEAMVKKDGLLSKIPFMGSKIEQKYGEKPVLEQSGTCEVSLLKDAVLMKLNGDLRKEFSGTKVFSLGGIVSPNTSREVNMAGEVGSRVIKGTFVMQTSPNARYNDFYRHPVETFCQNFVEKNINYQVMHFTVGSEITQKITVDEKTNSVMMSEEALCNLTVHKAAVTCTLAPDQSLSDFLDFRQSKAALE